jgi:hypothetical protein
MVEAATMPVFIDNASAWLAKTEARELAGLVHALPEARNLA